MTARQALAAAGRNALAFVAIAAWGTALAVFFYQALTRRLHAPWWCDVLVMFGAYTGWVPTVVFAERTGVGRALAWVARVALIGLIRLIPLLVGVALALIVTLALAAASPAALNSTPLGFAMGIAIAVIVSALRSRM